MPEALDAFDEIDRGIKALNLADFQPGGRHHFTREVVADSPGTVLGKVCAIYRAIRLILVYLQKFPLLPKSWRDALKAFMDLMDNLCPAG